ncbi:hypothetical protein [Crocosphaera watsonii]|uniref:type II toxin-antitoxin system Phd/YefM family antitoxin n=1 Tax=Crocosphaera watsonii TaxID=263511 RepID=UPI0030DB913C
MQAITSSQAKEQLDELIEQVILDVEPTIVCNAQGKKAVLIPNFSQNLRSPNTEALQEVGLNRAIADFPNQQSVVRF